MCVRACVRARRSEDTRGAGSLLPQQGSLGSSPGHQAWHQELVCAEPSLQSSHLSSLQLPMLLERKCLQPCFVISHLRAGARILHPMAHSLSSQAISRCLPRMVNATVHGLVLLLLGPWRFVTRVPNSQMKAAVVTFGLTSSG